MSKMLPGLCGRKKIDAELKRTRLVNVRMTESEYKKLELLSKMLGSNPSSFVYKIVQDKIQRNEESIMSYSKLLATVD